MHRSSVAADLAGAAFENPAVLQLSFTALAHGTMPLLCAVLSTGYIAMYQGFTNPASAPALPGRLNMRFKKLDHRVSMVVCGCIQ
jgi:hypothetical protein